jgi:hypothetical protein
MARPKKTEDGGFTIKAPEPLKPLTDGRTRPDALAHAVSLMGDAVKQYGPKEAGDVVLTLAKRFEDYING